MKKKAFTLVPLPSFPIPLYRLLVLMITLTIFVLSAEIAWGQPKSRCQEKVLESGTVEGIFAGIECGDNCYAEIIMDNGETFSLLCGEVEAEQYFGDVGNRVSLEYEVQQYWDDIYSEGYCARHEIVKSGKILVAGADPAIKKRQEEQDSTEAVAIDTARSYSDGRIGVAIKGFQLGMDEASFLEAAKALYPTVMKGEMTEANFARLGLLDKNFEVVPQAASRTTKYLLSFAPEERAHYTASDALFKDGALFTVNIFSIHFHCCPAN